jgi:hypothetical protein
VNTLLIGRKIQPPRLQRALVGMVGILNTLAAVALLTALQFMVAWICKLEKLMADKGERRIH